MFRNLKSGNAFERHEADDGAVDRHSASDGHGDTVASSALRWLKGSKKADAPAPNGLRAILAGAAAADRADAAESSVERSDDVEQAGTLAPIIFDDEDDDDGDPGSQEEPIASRGEGDEPPAVNDAGAAPFDFYDDDDDIDDFDDLGNVSNFDVVARPAPSKKTSMLAEIDLDDIASLEDLDDSGALPVTLDPATAGLQEFSRLARALDDDAIDEIPVADSARAPEAAELDLPLSDKLQGKPEAPTVEPAPHQSIMNVPLAAPSRKQPLATEPLNASLALQPIPELQTEARPKRSPSSDQQPGLASPPEDEGDDVDLDDESLEMLLDEALDHHGERDGTEGGDRRRDEDDLDLAEFGLDSPEQDASDDGVDRTDDDADFDLPASPADRGKLAQDMDDLSIAGLEDDSFELGAADETDDRSGHDWHAHLADVLGVLDDSEESDDPDDAASSSKSDSKKPPLRLREIDQPPVVRSEQPTPVLPLSKTLARLAMSNEPEEASNAATEDDDDVLIPPPYLPTLSTRRKTADVQPPTTLPADTAELTPEQLSFGIIANLSRLRRFSAVQIGDELVADRLVQSTIGTALADPAALEPTSDLGLALITLSHRLRQDILADPSAPIDMPEAARAFETAVCRGLAGADQFEIRQFARAINTLDEDERTLLVLVALENFSYDQIAFMLRMPTDRVLARISEGRMRLRQILATDEAGAAVKKPASDGPHDREIEIHGYLDGEIDGHHMADIDALVEYDDDAADRLLHYGIQGDLIRRLYAPLLNRPIPGPMLDAISLAARPPRRGFRFGTRRALIAGAVVIALCGGALWPYVAPTVSTFISDAMAISQAAADRQDQPGSAGEGDRLAGKWTTPRSTIAR